MSYSRRALIGMWLQRWTILHPLLLRSGRTRSLRQGGP